MNSWILVNVRYEIKHGKRDEFLKKVDEQGIIRDSKEEEGNIKYEYSKPIDSEDDLLLMEIWNSSATQTIHGQTEHYQKLQALKKEYVTDVTIEKYIISVKL
jgi:quinol monooxygenase YgiN